MALREIAISNWKRDSGAPGDSHSRNFPLGGGSSRPLGRKVTVREQKLINPFSAFVSDGHLERPILKLLYARVYLTA